MTQTVLLAAKTPTGAVRRPLMKCGLSVRGVVAGRRSMLQEAKAAKARAVISSTLPVPLMERYFGAAAGSTLAHWL